MSPPPILFIKRNHEAKPALRRSAVGSLVERRPAESAFWRNTDFQVCAPSGVLLRCYPVWREGGESPLGAQATGLCSARRQSTRPL